MPRYQREGSTDWVEIQGAAPLALEELDELYAVKVSVAQARLTPLIADCSFTNHKGEPVDPRESYRKLTIQQWNWLRDMCAEAARDEVVDPQP